MVSESYIWVGSKRGQDFSQARVLLLCFIVATPLQHQGNTIMDGEVEGVWGKERVEWERVLCSYFIAS